MRVGTDSGETWKVSFHRGLGRWILAPRWRPGPALILLEWALATTAACAIVISALLFSLYSAKVDLDADSRAFADASVSAIDTGGVRALARRASPDFRAGWAHGFMPDVDYLGTLGQGRAAVGCIGVSTIDPLGVYSLVTARYTCEVRSRLGESVIALTLGRELLAWKITGLYIAPPMPGRR